MMLNGKGLAAQLRERVRDWIEMEGISPKLAIISVGDDAASRVYINQKLKAAAEVGIEVVPYHFNEDDTIEQVETLISALNSDNSYHGIILQLPLPEGYWSNYTNYLVDLIHPAKDVDGLTTYNVGALRAGRRCFHRPCTAYGVIMMLEGYQIPIDTKVALVIGRSQLVGKPIADLLMERGATLMHANSNTPHETLVDMAQKADIIVSATGKPHILGPNEINPNAIIVDVGITPTIDENGNRVLLGDCCDIGEDNCQAITPVPGGVGPMTVAVLMSNTWNAYYQNK